MPCKLWLLHVSFKKKKCLIFTIDGAGDNGINATISVGEKGKIKNFMKQKIVLLEGFTAT